MERSREKVDLTDWYGNSWAKSQKFFFVAIWLVLLCEALLRCCVTFGWAGWMSLCAVRFPQVGTAALQEGVARAGFEGAVFVASNANPEM